jgi:hypothetical protein
MGHRQATCTTTSVHYAVMLQRLEQCLARVLGCGECGQRRRSMSQGACPQGSQRVLEEGPRGRGNPASAAERAGLAGAQVMPRSSWRRCGTTWRAS